MKSGCEDANSVFAKTSDRTADETAGRLCSDAEVLADFAEALTLAIELSLIHI